MRIWRASNDDHELFFTTVIKAFREVEKRAGKFYDAYEFAGVTCPPEPIQLESIGDGKYEYADWRIEPIDVIAS